MLNRADLARAQTILTDRDASQRVRDLVTTKGIELMAGDVKDNCIVVISIAYQRRIIADLTASLDQEIDAANAELTAMGVEP
ncbi:hypothetical protein [Mesorhizobium opportunistum]|uniref:Uncharacterized protein n=1 Tax=Mesorhizobium opportunistum (strain LMG 24607 / HAMBI 3007 / WSM2075) TaxID=536019 RepID=F7XZU0_MESOW|nr:hypothetical protein [Mesorhizobium opportunistum]AEH88154.1 hypothetical protein Mesop_3712 [Mesorhizobium opportunistum WSM2075]